MKAGSKVSVGMFGYDISSLLNDCYSAPSIPDHLCDMWSDFDGWTIGAALSIDSSLTGQN
jgi:hypothetical protein